jgi:hypothetical protein
MVDQFVHLKNVFSFILGGYLANSLAIITDAAHLLSDFASFLISLLAIWFATRPSTSKLSYGWHRAGEFISVVKRGQNSRTARKHPQDFCYRPMLYQLRFQANVDW